MTNRLVLQHGDALPLSRLYSCKHPTLLDIAKLQTSTDNLYLQYVNILTTTSLDIADILWKECNVWYEDIKDEWKFFVEKGLTAQNTVEIYKESEDGKTLPEPSILIDRGVGRALSFFIGTSDLYALKLKDDDISLVNVEPISKTLYKYTDNSFVLTKISYHLIRQFLSEINWTAKKDYNVVHGGTKRAKKYILEMEYKARLDDAKRHRETITLDSIVSSLIAKGISYKEIWNMPVYMVYDQYQRHVQFNQWDNTMRAMSSGNLDTKKHPVNWDKINWSRVLNNK